MTRDYVADRTPERWTLVAEAPETPAEAPGDWETLPRAVWEFDPRPQLKVAVRPKHESSRWGSSVSTYMVEKQNSWGSETYEAESTGYLPNVDVARQVMWGVDGWGPVDSEDVRIQIGLGSQASKAIGARIGKWEHLETIHRANTGFEYIDGIGPKSNERLERAIEGPFLDRERHEIVRNPDESEESNRAAVYAVLPCVDGWKVRKEWWDVDRDRDCPASCVMLPVEEPTGQLYDTLDDAAAAAETFADDRAGDPDDTEVNDVSEPAAERDAPDEQTNLRRWV